MRKIARWLGKKTRRKDAPVLKGFSAKEVDKKLRSHISYREFTFQPQCIGNQEDILLNSQSYVYLYRPDGKPWKGLLSDFLCLKNDVLPRCEKKRKDAPDLKGKTPEEKHEAMICFIYKIGCSLQEGKHPKQVNGSTPLFIIDPYGLVYDKPISWSNLVYADFSRSRARSDKEVRGLVAERGCQFQPGTDDHLLNKQETLYLFLADGEPWSGVFGNFKKLQLEEKAKVPTCHPLWEKTNESLRKTDRTWLSIVEPFDLNGKSKPEKTKRVVEVLKLSCISFRGEAIYENQKSKMSLYCPHGHELDVSAFDISNASNGGKGSFSCGHCRLEQELYNASIGLRPNLNLITNPKHKVLLIEAFIRYFGFELLSQHETLDLEKDEMRLGYGNDCVWLTNWANFIDKKAKAPSEEYAKGIIELYKETGDTSVAKAVSKIRRRITSVYDVKPRQATDFIYQNFNPEVIELYKKSTEYLHADHIVPLKYFLKQDLWETLISFSIHNFRLVPAQNNVRKKHNLLLSEIFGFTVEQREIYNLAGNKPLTNMSGEVLPRKLPLDEKKWEAFKINLVDSQLAA